MTDNALRRDEDQQNGAAQRPMDAHLEFLVREHEYLAGAITFADQKAAFVFAIAVGALTLGFNMHQYDSIGGQPLQWIRDNHVAASGVAFVLLAAALSLATLLPRLRWKATSGIMFWGDILSLGTDGAYA